MGKDLKNKTFIITGATKGLGEVVSKYFSLEGMTLILLGRDKKALKMIKNTCSKKSSIYTYTFDLLDNESVTKNIKKVMNKFNTIDGVIHIAGGGYGFREPLLDYNKFLTLLNLNLLSIVTINNLVIPQMVKNKKGNILHIGSIAGVEAVASVGYNTSKAALNGYVRSLGNEFAKDNIIINGINPGGFEAPNNAMARLKVNNKDAYDDFVNKKLPRNKMGNATELLEMIKLLSSDNASMLCGSMITMDAGEGNSYERI